MRKTQENLNHITLQRLLVWLCFFPTLQSLACRPYRHPSIESRQCIDLQEPQTINNIPVRVILYRTRHLPFYQTEIIYLTLTNSLMSHKYPQEQQVALKSILYKLDPTILAIRRFRSEHPAAVHPQHVIDNNPDFFGLPNPIKLQLDLARTFTATEVLLISEVFSSQAFSQDLHLNESIQSNASPDGRVITTTGFYNVQRLLTLIATLANEQPQIFRQR